MLIKNLTPFLHGAKVTSRRPPQPEMTLVIKGTFSLLADAVMEPVEEQPPLRAESFAEDDDERAGECLYPGDLADFKPRAEVLLTGACHPLGGRSVTECDVRMSVGAWSKQLRVVGPRVWNDGAFGRSPSEPRPFTRVELGYANAFGGPEHPENPVGKGMVSANLPQVELPDRPLKSPSDRLAPASFGPINPQWSSRASKVGKEYGKKWRAERHPYYAEDFDWAYFQAAPLDQQLPGPLRGDEEIVLQNLVPKASLLRSRLPAQRVRAFVKDTSAKIREMTLILDTLYIDAEERTATLVWRGLCNVKEHDLTDVKFVLVAAEPLADAPLPAAGYHAKLEAFADDPVGLKAAMPEGFDDFVERSKMEKRGEPLPDGPELEGLDPVSRMLKQRLGSFQSGMQGEIAASMKAGGPPPAQLVEALAKPAAADEPPVAVIKKPGALPNLGLRRQMRKILEEIARLKQSFAGREMPPEVAAKIVELDKIPFEPALKQVDPSYTPPIEPISTDAPGPHRNLSEQDLSGKDLSGMDLSGANLEDTLLIKTNLRGAKLVGANLRRAVLYKADLAGADLSGADLTQVNAASVRAIDARFEGCNLEMAFFEDAELEGANLGGVKGTWPSFVRANLRRAKLDAAKLERADFSEAMLEDASGADAALLFCTFEKCRAARINLERAKLDGARFPEADLTEGRLAEARGEATIWAGAKLDRADLSDAWFLSSHFPDISARGAQLTRANLRLGRFYRATLSQANLCDANLFGADLSRAELTDARFKRANLYDAKLHGAHGTGADFSDANLSASTLEGL